MTHAMSAAFTLHVAPHAETGDPEALERAELVRDGFSWWAALAPALWLFWHRHWLAGFAAIAAVAGLGAGLWALGARPWAIVAAEILLHLLFGLEGASLRRLSYRWRGRPVSGVVIASDLAEAEAKSFARWLEAPPSYAGPAGPLSGASAPWTAARARAGHEPVIGLFPDPEGRR